jgi:DNA repair protein Rad10
MAATSSSCLLVHEVQRGNPVLKYIHNVKWEYNSDIIPDYVMGSTCALFVSVKFHFRHPTVRHHGTGFSLISSVTCVLCSLHSI